MPDFRKMIETDRQADPPDRGEHFREVLRRDLELEGIQMPEHEKFADWVRASRLRCPSKQLLDEIHWSLVKNRDEALTGNLMADIEHALGTPYVDLITLDKSMRGHVLRADTSYQSKICRNLQEVFARLGTSL